MPTVTFNVLYVFFVLSLDRRRLVHINGTAHPYAEWAAQQIVEAVGFDTSIARLIRDRDRIYGGRVDARVHHLGVEQTRTAPRAPWQIGCAEGFVGTLRRQLLDARGERHRLRLIQEHMLYYDEDRPHMALDGDTPVSRAVQVPGSGRVVGLARVGGLHHRYARAA